MKPMGCVVACVLLCCGSGSLRAQTEGQDKKTWSYAKSHQVLKYLDLTEEQIQQIDALQKAFMSSSQADCKNAPKDAKERTAWYLENAKKRQAAQEALKTKIGDLLSEAQKGKYLQAEAANKAYADMLKEVREKALKELEEKMVRILGAKYQEDLEKRKNGAICGDASGLMVNPGF